MKSKVLTISIALIAVAGCLQQHDRCRAPFITYPGKILSGYRYDDEIVVPEHIINSRGFFNPVDFAPDQLYTEYYGRHLERDIDYTRFPVYTVSRYWIPVKRMRWKDDESEDYVSERYIPNVRPESEFYEE